MDVLRNLFSLIVIHSLFLIPCYCLNLKLFDASKTQNENNWQQALATWYGAPEGAGTDGGACGYSDSVEKAPLNKMISAGGPSIFDSAKGCGACYEVKCTENGGCSGKPVRVMITDQCPDCTSTSFHFDLSGTAFGSMATSGQADQLRNAGQINIQFRRVECEFGNSIAFTIDSGANPYYFATAIEYLNGDGDLVAVGLKQSNGGDTWLPMQRSWGARWALNLGVQLQPPFSIKLTDSNNKTIVANNVIPNGWQPGQVYRSGDNF